MPSHRNHLAYTQYEYSGMMAFLCCRKAIAYDFYTHIKERRNENRWTDTNHRKRFDLLNDSIFEIKSNGI